MRNSLRGRRLSRSRARARLLRCESLEERLLLAVDINWHNRGTSSESPFPIPAYDALDLEPDDSDSPDNFNWVFCGQSSSCALADSARNVVDAALAAWENVLTDFDDSENEDNIFTLTISMDTQDMGCGGGARTPGPGDPFNGKPDEGTIILNSCTDSVLGIQWFVDPTPNESSEFLGAIPNAYAGDAPTSSPAAGLSDLLTVVTVEMAHLLGISDDEDFLWEDLVEDNDPSIQPAGVGDAEIPGQLWLYDDAGIQALYTTNNGCSSGNDTGFPVHIAEPNSGNTVTSGAKTFFGVEDIGNACFENGRRYLPSQLMAKIFDEVYGFDFIPFNTFENFYIHRDAAGNLLVRGGSPGGGEYIQTGLSNDVFSLEQIGSDLQVRVDIGTDVPGTNATTEFVRLFPLSSINSITILGHDGISGGPDGDDVITLDFQAGNWIPPGGITVDGGTGNDILHIQGQTDFTVSDGVIQIGGPGNEINYSDIEHMTITIDSSSSQSLTLINSTPAILDDLAVIGGPGNDVVEVEGLAAITNLTVLGLGGDDDVRVTTTGENLDAADGEIVFLGHGGSDEFLLVDTQSALPHTFTFDTAAAKGRIRRGITHLYQHQGVEEVTLLAGSGNNTFQIQATRPGSNLTIDGGAGLDGFHVDGNGPTVGGTVDSIRSALTLLGGTGADTLQVTDTSDDDPNKVVITDVSIGPPPNGQFFGLGGVLNYLDMSNLTVSMGRNSDQVIVESTPSGAPLTIHGSLGHDQVTISAPPLPENVPPGQDRDMQGIVDEIKSLVTVNGEAGSDVLTIIDGTAITEKTATITDSTVGMGASDVFFGPGGGVVYSSLARLNVQMGLKHDHALVESTFQGTRTTLLMGGDHDLVDVESPAGTVNDVVSILDIDGQDDRAIVNLHDAADAAVNKVTVSSVQVGAAVGDTFFGPAGLLNYSQLSELHLLGGQGDDVFAVKATAPGTATEVHGGGGVDLFTVTSSSSVQQIRSLLTIDGGTGSSNAAGLIDTADVSADQVTITDSEVGTSLGDSYFGPGGGVRYVHLTQLNVASGLGNDTIVLQSTNPGTNLLVGGGGGNDGFRIDSNGVPAGGTVDLVRSQVTIIGGAGNNGLSMEDHDDPTGDTVSVRPTASNKGEVGLSPGDDYFGPGGGVKYEQMNLVLVATSNAGDDRILAAPSPGSAGALIGINANGPDFTAAAADQVDLDLNLVGTPALKLTQLRGGVVSSSTHAPLLVVDAELVDEVSGTPYDLTVDTNVAALGGNDGIAGLTEAYSDGLGAQKTLNLRVIGQQAFSGVEKAIRSLTVIGSTDADQLLVQETAHGLPRLSGDAPLGHLNGVYLPSNVGIHYDGGAGIANDEAKIALLNPHTVTKADDMVGPVKSGNINVKGEFTLSYVSLTPVEVQGAGGSLTVDSRLVTDLTELTLLNLGGNRFRLTGDGAFEATAFSGFDDHLIERVDLVEIHSGVVVNSTGDGSDLNPGDGICQTGPNTTECTLRAAIEETNAGTEDIIFFDIPGPCPQLIQPATALPPITSSVFIDGYTQPGAAPNTLPIDLGTNAKICIEVNGGLITDGSSGLVFQSNGNLLKGLSITGFGYPDMGDPGSPEHVPAGGVVILGGNTHIQGNFIGVDPDGTTADANNFYGLFVKSSDNVIGGPKPAARNLISGNQGFGIQLTSGDLPGGPQFVPAEFNRIQGNLIGTDRTGTQAVPNTGAGVILRLHARNNLIGGGHIPLCEPVNGQICLQTSEVRNIISGNGGPFTPLGDPTGPYQDWPDAPYPVSGGHGDGIRIENLTVFTSTEPVPNAIQGNFVGTTADGMSALPNRRDGIVLVFTNSVTVGRPATLASGCTFYCNLVSANEQHGITVASTFAKDIVIQGNLVGTDRTGFGPLGNQSDGVFIFIASGTLVGGNVPQAGNRIAFNRTGVVVKGNPDEPNPRRNTIRMNSIHSNRLLGIDLLAPGTTTESDGPTLNDTLDPDTGPNALQNFPVITSAQFGPTTFVAGTLNSLPKRRFRLDFYSSAAPDPSGHGEGQRSIGWFDVVTDAAGNATFAQFLPGSTGPGQWLSATATLIEAGKQTDTSEFSRRFRLWYGIGLADCKLQIHGTDAADRVQVARVDDQLQVTASFLPNLVRSFDASLVATLEIHSRGGDDSATVDLALPLQPPVAAPPCSSRTKIVADTGTGADLVELNLHGDGGEPEQATVDVRVRLGAGDDKLRSLATDLILADSSFDALGDDGADIVDLVFDGSGFDHVVQKVRGGAGADQLAVTWDGVDVEQKVLPTTLLMEGGLGANSLHVRSNTSTGTEGWRWAIHGGDDADVMMVERTSERTRGDSAVLVDAGNGDDIVSYTTSRLIVTGQDTVDIMAGDGHDRVTARRNRERVGVSDVDIMGDAGNDRVSYVDVNGVYESAHWGVDGGEGNDGLQLTLSRTDYKDLTLDVIGGGGDDGLQLRAVPPTTPGFSVPRDLTLGIFAGHGNDTVDVDLGNQIGEQDDTVVIEGGDGRDVITFVKDAWTISGVATLLINGGSSADFVNVQLTNLLLSTGTFNLNVLGGADKDDLDAVVHFQTTSVGAFNGLVSGDDEDDELLFDVLAPAAVVVSALLDGANGLDTCQASGVTVVNCEA